MDNVSRRDVYHLSSGDERPTPRRAAEMNYDDQGSFRRRPSLNLKPETYDGNSDWAIYHESFETVATLGNWSQRERTLALAAMLKGPALKFYISLDPHVKETYRLLIRALGQRFGSQAKHQAYWLSKLDSRFRLPGESPANWADDLIYLAQRAHPDLEPEAVSKLAYQQFLKGLRPELKWQCVSNGCHNLMMAADLVDSYEMITGDPNQNKRKVNFVNQQEPASSHIDTTLEKILKRLDRLEMEAVRNVPAFYPDNQRRSGSPSRQDWGPGSRPGGIHSRQPSSPNLPRQDWKVRPAEYRSQHQPSSHQENSKMLPVQASRGQARP